MKQTILIALPALALVACGQDTDTADNNAIDAPSENVVLPADETGAVSDTPADMTVADGEMPAALRGRWGMTTNDCDPAQADVAKGLIDIGADTVTFYESRGTLTAVEQADGGVRATYAMTGEGMEWTREMAFELGDDGQTMTRREYGDDAIPGPMEYQRCTA